MVSDEFALEKFLKNYGHLFEEVRLVKGPSGATEILAFYSKARFKQDWIPNHFCQRVVRCRKLNHDQAATPTPPVSTASE